MDSPPWGKKKLGLGFCEMGRGRRKRGEMREVEGRGLIGNESEILGEMETVGCKNLTFGGGGGGFRFQKEIRRRCRDEVRHDDFREFI